MGRPCRVFIIAVFALSTTVVERGAFAAVSGCEGEWRALMADSPDALRQRALENKLPKILPEQLLPPDFLDEITRRIGPVRIETSTESGAFEIRAFAGAQEDPFMKCVAFRDPRDAGAIAIDGLRLENPLPSADQAGLNHSQNRKGLPYKVFAHVKNQVLHFAKEAGFKRISSGGPQNVVVLTLYRKMLGMKPTHPQGDKIIAWLDKIQAYAKNSVPEPYRIKTLDEFSRTLGDVGDATLPSGVERAWWTYIRNNDPGPGFQLLKDENQKVIGLLDVRPVPAGQPRVFFMNPFDPHGGLLRFQDLLGGYKLGLSMDLP